MRCPKIEWFTHTGNPIEHIPPNVLRWEKRISQLLYRNYLLLGVEPYRLTTINC
jgi:hypothetical protein